MSGSKRSADTLNTIGIVVVGVCGAVLVYVTITALQAFYVNDTSDIQTMADYGGQDMPAKNLKAQQMGSINEYGTNAPPKAGDGKQQTFRMPIKDAKTIVVDAAKKDPALLLPALGRSDRPTVLPIYGRPKPIPGATTPPSTGSDAGSGSAAGSADAITPGAAGSGSGSAKGNAP